MSLIGSYIIKEEIVNQLDKSIFIVTKRENGLKYIMLKYYHLSTIQKNEIRILISLNKHNNLINCYDYFFDPKDKSFILIVDYAPYFTLHHYILQNQNKTYINEGLIWTFLIQMLYSIYPLHSNGIIHRNINNSNFFLFDNNIIKLGGFKLCKYNKDKDSLNSLPSHLNIVYSAPEISDNKNYESNSDIWSIGVCIHQMCLLPITKHQIEVYYQLTKGYIMPIDRKAYSGELISIISLMLKVDNKIRPNINQLLSHPLIISHIYNPIKYIDALSCGKGWIDVVPLIDDLENMAKFIEKFKKKKEIKKRNIELIKIKIERKKNRNNRKQLGIHQQNRSCEIENRNRFKFPNNGNSSRKRNNFRMERSNSSIEISNIRRKERINFSMKYLEKNSPSKREIFRFYSKTPSKLQERKNTEPKTMTDRKFKVYSIRIFKNN